ncbi:C-type lectin LmsL-like [Vanacampus margaritifer]
MKMAHTLCWIFLLCIHCRLWTGAWSKGTIHAKDKSCPQGWTRLNCRCFIYQDNQRAFTDAESVCNILGGNLASFHNFVEGFSIVGLLFDSGYNGTENIWIGLHDAIEDDDFIWTDGSQVDLAFLQSNFNFQPDGNGDCVFFSGLGLTDGSCTDEFGYVCSRDLLHS